MYDGLRRRKTDTLTEEEKQELDESFAQCPKYNLHELTDEQIDAIAEKAAKRAVAMARDDFYKDVGETVIGKFKWLVGAVVVGAAIWMAQHGLIKL